MNKNISSRDRGWQAVFDRYNLHDHDFCNHPYFIKAEQIKAATKHFETTGEREVRILCKRFFVTWYGSIGGHKSTKSLSGKRFN
jgi:hypothetical protein